jgi:hypothetical protein
MSAFGRKQPLVLSGEWLVYPRKQPLAKIELELG